jgi:exodeoxyribonuclease V beta subunit
MSTPPLHTPLDLAHDAVCHGLVVEASAGTGKTYSVAALVTRELALRDDLRIGQILITTFTRNAAAELRDRVRRRIVETIAALRSDSEETSDVLVTRLRDGTPDDRHARVRRLERAVSEFDTATISTIHGVCSRVLRAAGMEVNAVVDATATDRILTEVVNDVVVSRAHAGQRWDEKRIAPLVSALLGDPFLVPWIDPRTESLSPADRAHLEGLPPLLAECVQRVQAATASQPGYNDLLRLAHDLIRDERRTDLLLSLMQRFTLAIVDEAQDTDRLQWAFFKRLFPGGDGRALVTVGDPKQAIYGFRGADVRAYVTFAADARSHRTLTTNRRSDQPLLDILNASFAGQTFGDGITYLKVDAPPSRQKAGISGVATSVEFVELGPTDNQTALARPVLGKVIDLLDRARLVTNPTGKRTRQVEPRDIAVLVRSGGVGRKIQRALAQAGIAAVMGGTSSVMSGSMATDIRSLLDAMEQPSNLGKVRRAAATVFFGNSLADVGGLTDEILGDVQDALFQLGSTLTTKGIAALASTLEADTRVMTRIASGRQGERNVTDFLHIFEVMDSAGPRRGCSAEHALTIYSRLASIDDNHELVSRRVESDADAVKILTIHAAKGLQFPCVIVADLWKSQGPARSGSPLVFYDDDGDRKLDLSFAVEQQSPHAKARRQAADEEETQRLLYVAATRAEHALCVLVARATPSKDGEAALSVLEKTLPVPAGVQLVPPCDRTEFQPPQPIRASTPSTLEVATAPAVRRTFRRMSFSSLVATRGSSEEALFRREGAGHDEPVAADPLLEPDLLPAAMPGHDVVDLPAGVAVGTAIHEVFEHLDTRQQPLVDEVRRVVNERVMSRALRPWLEQLVEIITRSLQTPLGGHLGSLTLGCVSSDDRLSELEFSFGLPSLDKGVRAQQIGEVLLSSLPADDALRPYAATLAGPAFDIPIGGMLTGSIDAVLKLPESTRESPRLLLCDYKSNKLHRTGTAHPLAAYAPDRLPEAMADHHYPLQALLYGTAVYRMLRWRLPHLNPDDAITGILYAFLRGMQGEETPVDHQGRTYGVFLWQPPPGLWKQLSDLLATAGQAGAHA